MISQQQFNMAECEALRNIDRLLSVGVSGNSIAIVMTREIYLALSSYGYVHWDAASDSDGVTVLANYKGYDVYIIDDSDVNIVFRPAIKGLRTHGLNYDDLEIGDLIIADDNPMRLYAMTQRHPPCFSDIGRTVSQVVENIAGGRTTFADRLRTGQITDRNGRLYQFDPIRMEYTMLDGYNQYASPGMYASIDSLWSSLPDELKESITPVGLRDGLNKRQAKKKASPKERPLTPEDTKELDEFLSSFARKPMIESAT